MAVAVRTDADIRSDVKEQLAWDRRVDSSNIEVDVVDGTVILSGTVPTYPDRNQAQTDALQVPGVAAEEAARYTSGVLEVNNHLAIESEDAQDDIRSPQ